MISVTQRSDRYQSTTFITEMRASKRFSNSARSGFPKRQIPPKESMLPNLNNKNPNAPSDVMDQARMDHIYELLVDEIRRLKSEVNPMRQYYLKLKDHLLFQSRCAANSNIIMSEQVPDLSQAVGDDTFSSVIEGFQEQSDLNTEQVTELKNKFSNYWIIRLSCEVDAGRDELKQMKEDIRDMQEENEQVKSRLSGMKHSKEIQKVDQQRKKIQKLILDTSKAEQRSVKLEQLSQTLEKEAPHVAPENQAAFDEVVELSRKLNDMRQQYFKKCDELIATREKQMMELQKLEKKKNGKNSYQVTEPTERPPSSRSRKSVNQPTSNATNDEENNEQNDTTQDELPKQNNKESDEQDEPPTEDTSNNEQTSQKLLVIDEQPPENNDNDDDLIPIDENNSDSEDVQVMD